MACHFNFEKNNLLTLSSEPEGSQTPSINFQKVDLLQNYFHRLISLSKLFPWASIFSFCEH